MRRGARLFLGGLGGGLGGLGVAGALGDGLDDADGDGLAHVTDGEAAEGRVLGEGLDAEGLGGDHADHGGVAHLDELGLGLDFLAGAAVDLGLDLGELARDVRSVAVEHGRVAVGDLAGVVEDDDLGEEVLGLLGGVVLAVRADEATADVLDGEVLDVEADVVSGNRLGDGFVMHLNGFDFGRNVSGSEGDDVAGLHDAGLDAADGDGADTADLVDVLEGKAEGLVAGADGRLEEVKRLEEGGALVPRHVVGLLDHVVASPAGDGDEADLLDVVADLLEEAGELLLDLLVALLRVLDGVSIHLVAGDDHLLDAEGEGEERVLAGLALLGVAGLELALSGRDHENRGVGLRRAGDHVLDEVTVSGGIDDGDDGLGGLELPESDVDGDATLALGLELVKNPRVLERGLAHLSRLLLELLDGALVDTTALVDEVTGGGRLAGIDVADDDERHVDLFLAHVF